MHTKYVTIKTTTVGQNFGTEAYAVARNGREVARSRTCPLGFNEAAIADCRRRAEAKGYTVR